MAFLVTKVLRVEFSGPWNHTPVPGGAIESTPTGPGATAVIKRDGEPDEIVALDPGGTITSTGTIALVEPGGP